MSSLIMSRVDDPGLGICEYCLREICLNRRCKKISSSTLCFRRNNLVEDDFFFQPPMTLSGRSSMVEAALTGTPILTAADSFFCASGLSGWPETGGYLINLGESVGGIEDSLRRIDSGRIGKL
jgi:hypothetical protein